MKSISKINRVWLPFSLSLIMLTSVIINIASPALNYNLIPVVKKEGSVSDSAYLASLPLIQKFEKVTVFGNHIIRTRNNSFLNFIAPKTSFITDNLYAFSLFICGLIITFSFWNYDKEKPFTGRLSSCMNKVAVILFITWLLNQLRSYLFNKEILTLTKNEYTYESFLFEKPEFWVSLILFRLVYVMKKGEKIQQEQDLTV